MYAPRLRSDYHIQNDSLEHDQRHDASKSDAAALRKDDDVKLPGNHRLIRRRALQRRPQVRKLNGADLCVLMFQSHDPFFTRFCV